ncbi:MAG TPA: ImmA/IrrE family metallo-endopeptidase [Candidatus Sulfotelmatobacter sp.]|nr:ImmA/IrrE family metallo-endopeptidase [Candidatus Sulfotelmatobacter sp.]
MTQPVRPNPAALADATLLRSGQPRMANNRAVDVERIVREFCKIEPWFVPDLDLGGKPLLGLFSPTLNAIMVDSRQILVRQRFTLAHEIGHVQLEHGHGNAVSLFETADPEVFACTEDDESLNTMDEARAESKAWLRKVKEIRANKFAAHLLMPEGLVRDVWREEHGDPDRVAHALMVSKEALGYRLQALNLK